MLNIEYRNDFLKKISKIKNNSLKLKIKKQVEKIIENLKIGKPMRYSRKGTREIYVLPYRLAYAYFSSENKIVFLKIYQKLSEYCKFQFADE